MNTNRVPKRKLRYSRLHRKKPTRQVLFAGLLLAVLSSFTVMTGFEPLEQLDRISYDFMLRGLDKREPHPDILIVDIDEESLQMHGQWPWPRQLLARLFGLIRDGEPKSIGIDILFPEQDRTSLAPLISNLKNDYGVILDTAGLPVELLDHDLALAKVFNRGSFYLGTTFRFGTDNHITRWLPQPLEKMTTSLQSKGVLSPLVADDVVAPINLLAEAVEGTGFLNVLADRDGLIRKTPLLIHYGSTFFPSLSLATFIHSKGINEVALEPGKGGSFLLEIGSAQIPIDNDGNMDIRYRGPSGTYPYIAAEMILSGTVSPDIFKDKIVFVGSTAEGLDDTHPTPYDSTYSGVEVHATVAGALLDRDFIVRPGWSVGLQGLVLFLVILIALTGELRFSALAAGFLFFGLLVFFPILSYLLFYTTRVFVSPTSPLVLYVISFASLALMRFRREEIQTMHFERQLVAAQDMAIVGLASIVETRDSETGKHIIRTQKYVQLLAQYLSKNKPEKYYFDPMEIELLRKSSALHDVGKVGVPDRILLKPAPLTHDEYEEMKKHTLYGAEALQKADDVVREIDEPPFLEMAQEIALTHHERWDGKGYPQGLKGEEIPVSGRLMAIADVYDALVSERIYKGAMTHEEACERIKAGRAIHFDPEVTDAFAELLDEFAVIAEANRDH